MQSIINKVKFAIIISFFVISAIDCRMLDVWIGADQSETPNSQYLTITTLFELGLCLKSYPIIAPNQLAYNALKRNLEGKITIPFDDFDIYKSVDNTCYLFIPHSYKTKIENSLPKQFKENLKKYKEGKELTSKKTDKEFIKYHENIIKTLKQYTPEEIAIGFRIDPSSNVLQKVEKKNLQSVDYIESVRRWPVFNFVDSVKKLFVVGKGDFFGLWNVVLEGHGEYPQNIKMNLTINSIVKDFGEKGHITGGEMEIAGLKLPYFRDFIQFLTNKIDVNFFYYMTCFSGDLNMILPYITTLLNIRAGLENVKMFGKEQTKYIKESIISLKKPNFTIANGALTSKEVYSSGVNAMKQCAGLNISTDPKSFGIDKQIAQEYSDFKKFFNLLNKYGKDKAGNEATLFVKYNNEELKDILKAITPRYGDYFTSSAFFKAASKDDLKEMLGRPDPYGISGLPSVMFPGTEKFVAIALDNEMVVLSNVLVEKYKKENKSFNLEDKKAILIYPREISSEIKIIRKDLPLYPSIVSMIPGLSLHKIDNMKIETFAGEDVDKILSTFLKDSFQVILPASPKYFYIKKLTITKGGVSMVYDNAFIATQEKSINVVVRNAVKSKKDIEIKISNNSFLNSIYNYFVLNPEKAKVFNFDDIKSLLTKEELDILNNVGKKENIKKEEKTKKTESEKTSKEEVQKEKKAISEKTKEVEKKEKVTQDKTSKEKKIEKVKIPETKDLTKKKIETSKAKAQNATVIKAKTIREKVLAAAEAKAAKAKAQKAAAMKAKAIREKILAAAKAKAAKAKAQKAAAKVKAKIATAAAKAKAQKAAAMKAKAIREKALAAAKAKAAKAKAQKAKTAKKK